MPSCSQFPHLDVADLRFTLRRGATAALSACAPAPSGGFVHPLGLGPPPTSVCEGSRVGTCASNPVVSLRPRSLPLLLTGFPFFQMGDPGFAHWVSHTSSLRCFGETEGAQGVLSCPLGVTALSEPVSENKLSSPLSTNSSTTYT